jgi:hypothetical protein
MLCIDTRNVHTRVISRRVRGVGIKEREDGKLPKRRFMGQRSKKAAYANVPLFCEEIGGSVPARDKAVGMLGRLLIYSLDWLHRDGRANRMKTMVAPMMYYKEVRADTCHAGS